MTRPAHLLVSRLRVVLIAGAVGVSTLTGTTAAHATPNVTDLEATVLRIGGAAVTGTNEVPSGRTLTPVRLTTADPASSEGDGLTLSGATPTIRIGSTTIPGTPAEQATFRIDGITVATSVPDLRPTTLQTDAGAIAVLLFTASGKTYAIPRSSAATATRTVATPTSTASSGPADFTYQYGLLPAGTRPRVGTAFTTQQYGPDILSSTTASYTVLDADNVRRNAGAPAEELMAVGAPGLTYSRLIGTVGEEVLATVTLRNGATVTVSGVLFARYLSYGGVEKNWFLDRAALAAAGGTVADVTAVVSSAPADHALTWRQLGFDRP